MNCASLAELPRANSPLRSLPRANVLGVGVHAVDLSRAAHLIHLAIERGHKGYVCVTSVHGVMEAQRDLGRGRLRWGDWAMPTSRSSC